MRAVTVNTNVAPLSVLPAWSGATPSRASHSGAGVPRPGPAQRDQRGGNGAERGGDRRRGDTTLTSGYNEEPSGRAVGGSIRAQRASGWPRAASGAAGSVRRASRRPVEVGSNPAARSVRSSRPTSWAGAQPRSRS